MKEIALAAPIGLVRLASDDSAYVSRHIEIVLTDVCVLEQALKSQLGRLRRERKQLPRITFVIS